MNILYGVIIAPILFAIIAFGMWFFLNKSFSKKVTRKGVLILKLDIKQRVVFRYDRQANIITDKVIFDSSKKAQWVPLERLTKSFVGTPGEKLIRNALVELSRGKKEIKFEFVSKEVIDNTNIRFFFSIRDIEGTDKFNVIVRWKDDEKGDLNLRDVDLLDTEKIAKSRGKYKAFIAFGLNEHVDNIHKHMAHTINTVSRINYKNMIVHDDVFVVIISSISNKGLSSKIKTFKKEITKNGYKIGVRSFFTSSAIISAKEVNTGKRVSKVIRALDYYLNLSLRTKEQFVDESAVGYIKSEYDEYIVETKNLRAATRAGTFDLKLFPVRTAISTKKAIDYVKPVIEGMSEKIFRELMRNKFNNERLINSAATEIGINKRIKVPVIIDVTANWLLENADKINYKKAIYIVKLNMVNTAPFVEVIEKLTEKGFIFGLRITKFKDSTTILIKNIKPKFVVIDETMSSVSTFSIYQQLFSIKTFAGIYKFKTIFENPPEELTGRDVNKKRINAIGMTYYYNYKKR